jgi:hypothetical protein
MSGNGWMGGSGCKWVDGWLGARWMVCKWVDGWKWVEVGGWVDGWLGGWVHVDACMDEEVSR